MPAAFEACPVPARLPQTSTVRRLPWLLPVLLLAGAVIAVLVRREPSAATDGRRVQVTRSNIVKVATAVGRIEVLYEVPVNSLWGGIMTRARGEARTAGCGG